MSAKRLMRNLALPSENILEKEGVKNSLHREILQQGRDQGAGERIGIVKNI